MTTIAEVFESKAPMAFMAAEAIYKLFLADIVTEKVDFKHSKFAKFALTSTDIDKYLLAAKAFIDPDNHEYSSEEFIKSCITY
jgi:hypothetical protein